MRVYYLHSIEYSIIFSNLQIWWRCTSYSLTVFNRRLPYSLYKIVSFRIQNSNFSKLNNLTRFGLQPKISTIAHLFGNIILFKHKVISGVNFCKKIGQLFIPFYYCNNISTSFVKEKLKSKLHNCFRASINTVTHP